MRLSACLKRTFMLAVKTNSRKTEKNVDVKLRFMLYRHQYTPIHLKTLGFFDRSAVSFTLG